MSGSQTMQGAADRSTPRSLASDLPINSFRSRNRTVRGTCLPQLALEFGRIGNAKNFVNRGDTAAPERNG